MEILQTVNAVVWGAPALVLILGVGIYLSVAAGFPQIRLFPKAMRQFVRQFRQRKVEDGTVPPFQALCTALAATVGTGNIAGVAGAIAIGGAGAIFWMWICAFLGMVTKFAEAALAVRFREKNTRGELVGGPMYMIRRGMGNRWHFLAGIYCFFGVVAAFGVGNGTQINAVIGGVNQVLGEYGVEPTAARNLAMGMGLAVLIGFLLLGGAKRIGQAAQMLVPLAAVGYVLLCLYALIKNGAAIPQAFCEIVTGAFSPRAVTGGAIGSAFQALRVGVSRGVFTNEAGMGTASIAHAGANVRHPVQQGMMGMVEVFLDTIVICTLTALVILTSGVAVRYGVDEGAVLTIRAFSAACGSWVGVLLTAFLCCFALATVLGWGFYGGRCAQYLFGDRAWRYFSLMQIFAVMLSAVAGTQTVWLLSEMVNGMMAIPNLIALLALRREYVRLIRDFTRGKGTARSVPSGAADPQKYR